MTPEPLSLKPVAGVRVGTANAGIRQAERPDVALFELAEGSVCAAVFTRNAFCAAPVVVARSHLAAGRPRAWIINSGNANAGTGMAGLHAAQATCTAVARILDCQPSAVMPFSTGVIGEPLPVERIRRVLPHASADLTDDGWESAARAIMTTDTVSKGMSRRVVLSGGEVTVTGIAKGAGMIRPDMATMLAFVATDAMVARPLLQQCLQRAVERSFNRITVDGDTSTNDACVLAATGQAKGVNLTAADNDYEQFCTTVGEVCEGLAKAIVRDGEGATKLITVDVRGGVTSEECLQVAYAIANSPLVKTAFFASDPNWGRILAAVGRAGLHDLDLGAVRIFLDDVCIVSDGSRAPDYHEAAGAAVMARSTVTIGVELGRGKVHERVWTCDLSFGYVRINAEYRT